MSNEISSFRQSRNKLNMFNLFRLCRKDEISFCCRNRHHCCQKWQQCGSNIRLCRKNCLTCSIRQCCFDIVAGVDGAQQFSDVNKCRKLERKQCERLKIKNWISKRTLFSPYVLSRKSTKCSRRRQISPHLPPPGELATSVHYIIVIIINSELRNEVLPC